MVKFIDNVKKIALDLSQILRVESAPLINKKIHEIFIKIFFKKGLKHKICTDYVTLSSQLKILSRTNS